MADVAIGYIRLDQSGSDHAGEERDSGIPRSTLALAAMRASQINGGSACLWAEVQLARKEASATNHDRTLEQAVHADSCLGCLRNSLCLRLIEPYFKHRSARVRQPGTRRSVSRTG
ncbi:carboxymuconolactone decarboxylase family protein [Nocardia amamiensis]|uniref:carboxymuconolactone decarboxylase family protein n=1 Tax=Nocardia amamiensis TaxID=404578 RepID=UPI000A7A9557|nr:carboxymuconolactone decarboxylase family protein [Nocardia amamiensis]